MIYKFGDIVFIKFPFSDGRDSKVRPALVIYDGQDGDIVVSRITTKLYTSELDFLISEWKKSGLLAESVVRIHKLATLEKYLIAKKVGEIDLNLKIQILNKLTQAISDISFL